MDYRNYLESRGFTVRGRHIYKSSQRTRKKEVCGILNATNFYMFSENVQPFKAGINFFDSTTLTNPNDLKQYIKEEIAKERNDFNISFEQYDSTSSNKSVLLEHYSYISKTLLARKFNNHYDIKSYNDFTAFPFIDFEGNFLTAQLIKYDTNGKRIKTGFSTTWLHSYKQAKKRLELKAEDKYTLKVSCFFGEHYLKDSSKPVAIVEAPKTAVLLKHLYPNIDWLATAGESGLFNKDLSLLQNRDVILYADCNTTQWQEFAHKNGFTISKVLESNNCEAGSDLADYVLNAEHNAYYDINAELYAIENRDFDFNYCADKLQLEFKNSNANLEYFTAVPQYYKGKQIRLKQDNSFSKKEVYRDAYFTIYKDKYNLVNAQLDWHKQKVLKGGKLRGFNEKEFIKAVHECYTVLAYLNKDADIKNILSITLDKLIAESNFYFNTKYITDRLVPVWQGNDNNLMQFIKRRKWKYIGKQKRTRGDFITKLNDARFNVKLRSVLRRFAIGITRGTYICHSELFKSRRDASKQYRKINELRKEWNKKVIGVNNINQLTRTLKILECSKNVTTSYTTNILGGYKSGTRALNTLKKANGLTNTDIAEQIGINRKYIAEFLSFKPCKRTRDKIILEIKDLLSGSSYAEPIRTIDKKGKKRITDFKIVTIKAEVLPAVTLKDAFNIKAETTEAVTETAEVDTEVTEVVTETAQVDLQTLLGIAS